MTRPFSMLQLLRAALCTRRWHLMVLLAVFVCAQALAFMHGALHAIPAVHGSAHTKAAIGAHVHHHAAHAHEEHGGMAALFSAHEDAEDCRLFDGMGTQLPLMVSPAHGLMALASATLLRLLDGGVIARWAALFDARGPPASH